MLRLAAVLPLLALAPAIDAKCAMMGLAPSVLTKSATVPRDGGLVLGATDVFGNQLDKGDVAVHADWKLNVAGARIAPTIETLAPGLAVYRLPPNATTGELEDDAHKVVGKIVVATDQRPLLAAPKVGKIVHSSGQGRRPFARIEVQLVDPVPAGAIALVLADKTGTPRSWHVVEPGKSTAPAYDLTRCHVLANGTVESKPSDQVIVMWIDDAGRKSPASKPFAITGTPPLGRD